MSFRASTGCLQHCLDELARMDCPTDPVSVRSRPCPRCGRLCRLHYGRRGQTWFFQHPAVSGGLPCALSCGTWHGKTKDDAEANFAAYAAPPGESPPPPAEGVLRVQDGVTKIER